MFNYFLFCTNVFIILIILAIYSRLIRVSHIIIKKQMNPDYLIFKETYLKKFGQFLVDQNLLTLENVELILKIQKEESYTSVKFGKIAVKLNLLTEKQLLENIKKFVSMKENLIHGELN